ncbi:hypothetical protein ANME2D_01063 [Candidatus Methanoperedens nitroreducens]|uniref:Uncharacterized protein n=2 Tax=Candidatus Methanoperedens nitratireducens TaxID=1392998 RepID=A0A062V5M8_9EURY|nr:hypothetical protein ANME2D_01063 [Candidatus Methanoperedens nitroreducens]MDJ1423435.1 hypothetical protein [Candidatus Methanoperedens sp.]
MYTVSKAVTFKKEHLISFFLIFVLLFSFIPTSLADSNINADLISSLPDAVKEKQLIENPYSKGSALHSSFANGWYSGYIGTQILSMFLGFGELKAVTSSAKFTELTGSVLTKMDDLKMLLRTTKGLRITERVGAFLVDDAASLGLTAPADTLGKIKTAVKQARVMNHLTNIGNSKITSLSGYHNELVDILLRTGDDGAKFVNKMDDATLMKMFSLRVSGVPDRRLLEFRAGLVQMWNIGISEGDVGKYIDDISKVTDIPGARKFIDKTASTNDIGNFKSLAFEADRAAYYRQITSDMVIEPIKQIDLKVGNKYIELKASFGSLTENKIMEYLGSGQKKFGDNIGLIGSNPTKLEISAREGLGSLDANMIKNKINSYMSDEFVLKGKTNYISEIEVFLPNGNSIRGIRGTSGLFEWV